MLYVDTNTTVKQQQHISLSRPSVRPSILAGINFVTFPACMHARSYFLVKLFQAEMWFSIKGESKQNSPIPKAICLLMQILSSNCYQFLIFLWQNSLPGWFNVSFPSSIFCSPVRPSVCLSEPILYIQEGNIVDP